MRIKFARSARKHRVARFRILYVIEHSGMRLEQPPPPGSPAGRTVRLVYLGDDAAGLAIEVMAIDLVDGDMLVIHAMPLRERYREQYEELRKERR